MVDFSKDDSHNNNDYSFLKHLSVFPQFLPRETTFLFASLYPFKNGICLFKPRICFKRIKYFLFKSLLR